MNKNPSVIKKIKIRRADDRVIASSTVEVVREVVLAVMINKKPYAHIACAGMYLEDLAAGFLRSENMISSRNDILKMDLDALHHSVNITLGKKKKIIGSTVRNIASSGARGKCLRTFMQPLPVGTDKMVIKTSRVLQLMNHLLTHSKIHNRTGGTHCSALALGGKIIALREDIGRHNTIDMLGGHALLRDINLSQAIILTTGRISSEIVYKIRNMGIPVIISHSAPTENAVALADQAGMTLIGYVRGGTMNIYTHERRVVI